MADFGGSMQVKFKQGGLAGKLEKRDDVDFVICYTSDGDPLFVLEQVGKYVVRLTRANEPEFPKLVAQLLQE